MRMTASMRMRPPFFEGSGSVVDRPYKKKQSTAH